jgi:hypothetical protein
MLIYCADVKKIPSFSKKIFTPYAQRVYSLLTKKIRVHNSLFHPKFRLYIEERGHRRRLSAAPQSPFCLGVVFPVSGNVAEV